MEQFQSTMLELIKCQMQRQQESEERFQKELLNLQEKQNKIQEENEMKQLAVTELIHKAILSKQKNSDENIFLKTQYGRRSKVLLITQKKRLSKDIITDIRTFMKSIAKHGQMRKK